MLVRAVNRSDGGGCFRSRLGIGRGQSALFLFIPFLLALVLALVPVHASAAARTAGGTAFLGHVFPVDGPHGTRGYIGEFGAPRDGGRTHEGFDIVAACGTPLVAVRAGKVMKTGYDQILYGNYL